MATMGNLCVFVGSKLCIPRQQHGILVKLFVSWLVFAGRVTEVPFLQPELGPM
jgi:hypothetical protein